MFFFSWRSLCVLTRNNLFCFQNTRLCRVFLSLVLMLQNSYQAFTHKQLKTWLRIRQNLSGDWNIVVNLGGTLVFSKNNMKSAKFLSSLATFFIINIISFVRWSSWFCLWPWCCFPTFSQSQLKEERCCACAKRNSRVAYQIRSTVRTSKLAPSAVEGLGR